MLIDPMYYAVFYDVELPKNDKYAMKKRINYHKYMKITEGDLSEKNVELDGVQYEVFSISTFRIQNSVDNTLFAVCNVKKLNL